MRDVCGNFSGLFLRRTWISRSSAFVLFHGLEREKVVEAQVKSWFQGDGSLEAAPLCHGNDSSDEKF